MTEKPIWRERLSSPLTWHYAGFSVLLVVAIVLATRFVLDWSAASSRNIDALAGKQVELKAMESQTAPLRGLDKRVAETRDAILHFYEKRIPANYSSIAEEIGNLEVKSGVRLSRVQYAQGKPGSNLTQITLDAGVTGDYTQMMRFINSLERDRTFFVIRAMQFTGQQGGVVNLRLRVSTWLRPADAVASGLPEQGSATAEEGRGEEGEAR